MKKFFKCIMILLIALCINLTYYVFIGQKKSTEKLIQNKELSLYECISIYQMHTALWIFGWPLSPEAAKECLMLHFPLNRDIIQIDETISSPKIDRAILSLKNIGDSIRISWNGYDEYSINSFEHRAAIALNPCVITRIDSCNVVITSSMQYPKYSDTKFDLDYFKIPIQEGLFRYLQDKGWLDSFIIKYKMNKALH